MYEYVYIHVARGAVKTVLMIGVAGPLEEKLTLSIQWVDVSTIVEWPIETAVSGPMGFERFA